MELRHSYPRRPRSVKLAGVKHGLYHPRLPTLRRMDIDTAAHRLPLEHSRTTTFCNEGERCWKNAQEGSAILWLVFSILPHKVTLPRLEVLST